MDKSLRVRYIVANQLYELCEGVGPEPTKGELVPAYAEATFCSQWMVIGEDYIGLFAIRDIKKKDKFPLKDVHQKVMYFRYFSYIWTQYYPSPDLKCFQLRYHERFYFNPGETGFKVFQTKFAKISMVEWACCVLIVCLMDELVLICGWILKEMTASSVVGHAPYYCLQQKQKTVDDLSRMFRLFSKNTPWIGSCL
ncbi:unnamed protein product [Lactuca saligna]|uniref:Uncharacterized protein n=1 Tax=Lactuca saligna TaxID=75948 RepID=A0AA35Z8E6_LACSI|nr:unnamed protein product [Lactuca saligna]